MSTVTYDDPVADALAWKLANQRREALAAARAAPPIPPARPRPAARPVETCHYCPEIGETRDHIVPRSRLTREVKFGGLSERNIVPCCSACNGRKADLRSDCGCSRCIAAWIEFGPEAWQDVLVVPLVARHRNFGASA
jgi:hypothetical protein